MVLNENFLSGLEKLPPPQNQQQTFMEIAGYPHFENVCSNILQFYLTPTNEHGFGRLLLDSLVMLIDRDLVADEQNIEVWREVRTSENKRIDLVVVSGNYIIGIENKVLAKVNNPFCDYTMYLNSLSGDSKKVYKILLSLNAEKESIELCGFKPVTYNSFLNKIEEQFESYSQKAPNEHLVFLKDFIQTMRNLQKQSKVDSQRLKYFQDKDDDIKILLTEIAVLREDMRMKLKQLEQLIIIELEIFNHFTEQWFWTHPTFVGDMIIYTIDPDKFPLFVAIILTPTGWKMQFWNKQTDLKKNTESEKERLKRWFDKRLIEYKVTGGDGSAWRLEVDGFKDRAYDTKLEEITESIVEIWNKLNKESDLP
jgi:PD-(D/E)XK nuclease superfamily